MPEDLALMEQSPDFYGVPGGMSASTNKRRKKKRAGVSTAKKRSPPDAGKDFQDGTENEEPGPNFNH